MRHPTFPASLQTHATPYLRSHNYLTPLKTEQHNQDQ